MSNLPARRVASLPAAILLVAVAGSAPAQDIVIEAEFYPTWACFPPMAQSLTVPFSGILAYIHRPLAEVLAAFPDEWEGKPRIRVGLDVRPPGLRLRFANSTSIYPPYIPGYVERLTFEPQPPVTVDSVHVNWYPLPGQESPPFTFFPPSCMFVLDADSQVLVNADAVINLVGVYASLGDTIAVWGSEVGIPDVALHDEGVTILIAVEEATWGAIKATWK